MTFRSILLSIILALAATASASGDEMVARNLIISQGCKGCHAFEGNGGTLGPALDKVGARLNAEQIEAKLLDPKASNRDSLMPSYEHLKDEQLKSLVDFLKNRK